MENLKLTSRPLGLLLTFLLAGLLACNEVTTNTTPPPSPDEGASGDVSADPNNPTGNTTVVLGSSFIDPVGTLSLLPINEPREATLNVQTTHSDAIVRSFDNILYVVNRLGADNIEVVDPSQNFAVTQQFSTGQGTNPQQIIVTQGSRGYISLYQPEDNGSEDLTVDDILIMNLLNGAILKTIDLTPYAADDGEPLPRASAMVIVGNNLYVAIQDLPSGFLGPDQPGKIVVIDTATDTVTNVATLSGRNPVAMNYSTLTGMIYITDADYTDTSSPYGGIEVVNPDTLENRMFIDDADLGGAPAEIELNGSKGFAAVSFFDENFNFLTKVVSFDLDPEATPSRTDLYQSQGYIQDIAVDENHLLLVGDRDPEVNGILFIDPETGNVVDGPINTGNPPSSITFVDR